MQINKSKEGLQIKETVDVLSDCILSSKDKNSLFLIFKEIVNSRQFHDGCKILYIELVIEVSSLTQIFFIKQKIKDNLMERKTQLELKKIINEEWDDFLDESYDDFYKKFNLSHNSSKIMMECFQMNLSNLQRKEFLKSKEIKSCVLYSLRTYKYFI